MTQRDPQRLEAAWLDALDHLKAERDTPSPSLDAATRERITQHLLTALADAEPQDPEHALNEAIEDETRLWEDVDREVCEHHEPDDVIQLPRASRLPWSTLAMAAAGLLALSFALWTVLDRRERQVNVPKPPPVAAVETQPEPSPVEPVHSVMDPRSLDIVWVEAPLDAEERAALTHALTMASAASLPWALPMADDAKPPRRKRTEPEPEVVEVSPPPAPPETGPSRLTELADATHVLADEQARYFQRVSEGCRERARVRVAGRVVLDVKIDDAGRVVHTAFVTRDLGLEIARCLEREVQAWTFSGAEKRHFQMVFRFREKT